jgi:hypothetical protein
VNWFQWYLVAHFALGGVAPIFLIGKERPKITPPWAALGVIGSAAMIYGIVAWT